MPRVGTPALSPDGKWVVMPVTMPAYDDKDQTSDLWLVPADGSAAPRKLTSTKASESGVTWSADSRRIAFSTRREGDEANQIYVLDLAVGGEAARVTTLSTGAASPKFSPGGNAILFTSLVYHNATDDAANKKAAAERKDQKYKSARSTAFPSATGTDGSTIGRFTCSCSRSSRGARRKICSPGQVSPERRL
jgi:Tol biopolymer transport system component